MLLSLSIEPSVIGQSNTQVLGLHHEFDIGMGDGIGTLSGRRRHDIPHLTPISVSPRISATLRGSTDKFVAQVWQSRFWETKHIYFSTQSSCILYIWSSDPWACGSLPHRRLPLGPSETVPNSIYDVIICGETMSAELILHFWEQVTVGRSQIRRIG